MPTWSDSSSSWVDFLAVLEHDDGDIDRDALESERESCVRKLDVIEVRISDIEDSFEDNIEKARSADLPDQYHRRALSKLHRFQQKQAEYESVAAEYVIVSTLLLVADQHGDLHASALDGSDELSDRQRDIVNALWRGRHIDRSSSIFHSMVDDSDIVDTLSRDPTLEKIRSWSNCQIDYSALPSEYRKPMDEGGRNSVAGVDPADYPNHEQKITWLEQITEAVLEDGPVEIPEGWELTDDCSDLSLPIDDLPEDSDDLSLEDDFLDI